MLRVGIVGCGTAGQATAALLASAGHRVTAFERVPDPGPVGAGIVLQPTGLSVLARLGLLGRVLDRGARLDALRCVTPARRTVVELPYARLAPGLFGLGTHRGLLFEALLEAMDAAGVTLRCGVDVGEVEPSGNAVTLRDAGGTRHGPFDLVVLADGARSALRRQLGTVRREREYPWGALWHVSDDADGVYRGELLQVVEGTERFLGLLPTGLGPGDGEGPAKLSLFWSVPCERADAVRHRELDAVRRAIVRYDPRAEAVADELREPEQLLFARYHDVVLSSFHRGRAVCIGDAAHSMSPQLGQGANLALWDAMVLADAVAEAPDVPLALARYSAARRRHLAFYQRMSRWLTPLFQSHRRWLAPVRDWGMGLACRLPWVRNQMIRTMCGVKRGLLRPSLSLQRVRRELAAGD